MMGLKYLYTYPSNAWRSRWLKKGGTAITTLVTGASPWIVASWTACSTWTGT